MATGWSGSNSAPEFGRLLKKWNRFRRKVLANDIVQISGHNSVRMVAPDYIQKERLRAVASRGRVWARGVGSLFDNEFVEDERESVNIRGAD
jgi:hypothetical protein